jgi:hypothetical protein
MVRFLSFCVLLVALLSPGISLALGPPPLSRVTGQVVDILTGEPIAGVRVTAYLAGDTVTMFTDPNGRYEPTLGGRAELRFAKPGYKPRLVRWPDDLRDPDTCPCCRLLNPVFLERQENA